MHRVHRHIHRVDIKPMERVPSASRPALRRAIRPACRMAILCLFLFALAGLLAACDDTDAGTSQAVTFTTEDGVTLGGHLFGAGQEGIILAHMYPADQTSWFATAERLAQEGYLVLTFDFRGYGESEGRKDIEYLDRDVLAALFAIADAGAGRVVMVGASMGGTASLIAADASQPLSRVLATGVATLSAPVEFKGLSAAEAVPRLLMPLLFMAAEDDSGAGEARQLRQLSGDAGDLQIVPGHDHGTDLLEGSQADHVWELLLAFVQQNLPVFSR
jgi:dienelactone hydrolase